MKRKITAIILMVALVLALAIPMAPAAAHIEIFPQTVELIADGGSATTEIVVGEVNVWNDGTNLFVTYEITEPGWLLVKTHLEVVESKADFPTTKKGNPKVGRFTWSETHEPPVTTFTYTILLTEIGDGVVSLDDVVIAAHAEVVFLDETCIDFETYSEFDDVDTVITPNGDVNFYMTDYTALAALNVGDSAALAQSGDLLPVVAEPGTNDNPTGTYPNIVAFTTGGPLYTRADDIVLDDNGTGAGGNTLTDPQYELAPEGELMWHAYSQFLGIVIDVSALDWVEDMGLVTIDLDHEELWHFLYFDAAGTLLHKDTIGPGTSGGDGKAFPISWTDDEYSIAKVVVFGEMNTNDAGIVGYAIDNICITSVIREETAWGAGGRFVDKGNWATHFTYNVQANELQTHGEGTAEWVTDPVHSGDYSVKLYVPDGGTDMAAVAFDVDIALEDITTLSFWKMVTDYDTNGWNPSVILLIDADGDGLEFGISEAMTWHFTHSAALLGDDAFVELESPTGLLAIDGAWVQLDALAMSAWGADASGFLYGTGGYNAGLTGFQSGGSYGVIDPTDRVLMVAIVIGGAGSWMDETAYIDDVVIAGP